MHLETMTLTFKIYERSIQLKQLNHALVCETREFIKMLKKHIFKSLFRVYLQNIWHLKYVNEIYEVYISRKRFSGESLSLQARRTVKTLSHDLTLVTHIPSQIRNIMDLWNTRSYFLFILSFFYWYLVCREVFFSIF